MTHLYNIKNMPNIIIIDRSGSYKTTCITSMDDVYKRCGFKSPEGFEEVAKWAIDTNSTLLLYAKSKGRAQMNQFEFPPPIDTTPIFGSCAMIKISNTTGIVQELSVQEFEQIYETLYGGFENIEDSNDEESDNDDTSIPLSKLTKEGYVKDGFIVSDEEDVNTKSTTISNNPPIPVTKRKRASAQQHVAPVAVSEYTQSVFLNCTDELEEEAYI